MKAPLWRLKILRTVGVYAWMRLALCGLGLSMLVSGKHPPAYAQEERYTQPTTIKDAQQDGRMDFLQEETAQNAKDIASLRNEQSSSVDESRLLNGIVLIISTLVSALTSKRRIVVSSTPFERKGEE